MSEFRGTKGEWEIVGDDECPAGVPVIEISADGGRRLVAYVQPDGDDGKDFSLTDEDRANAALIASAPALLAALEAIVNHPGAQNVARQGALVFAPDELAQARAALALAATPEDR